MAKKYTLAELAELTNSKLIGDKTATIASVCGLEEANEEDASFLANPRYEEAMKLSKAGVICVDPSSPIVEGKNFLVNENPSRAFQKIAEAIMAAVGSPSAFNGIHPNAIIHPSAKIGKNTSIGPNVTIDADVVIGENCRVFPGTTICARVEIGNKTIIHSNVTLREDSKIGSRVEIQPGAVIGSCGFGFTTDEKGQHHKLQQLGNVVIEDDVGIGANTCIDRARFHATVIKKGTQIDNLVQIAHNVSVGENSILVSQCGIAGSTKLGRNVCLGGQVGVVGHIELCDQTIISSRGAASKSIKKPGVYRGEPVMPIQEYQRMLIHLRKIEKYVAEIKELKEKVKQLEESNQNS